jgi:hypothetical protein
MVDPRLRCRLFKEWHCSSELIWILHNISVRTSKRTHSVSTTKPFWLILCRESKTVYSENYTKCPGAPRWRSRLRHCATSRKVAGSIPDVAGIFHWHNLSRPHYGPGIDSASNRNEYQEYFLGEGGCKGGRCVGLTVLPPSCAGCLEIWEPGPPGTLRACPGL